jgi:hypothetical protein
MRSHHVNTLISATRKEVVSHVHREFFMWCAHAAAVLLLQISISGKHYCASVPGDVVWLLSRLLPENVIANRFMIMHMLSSRCVVVAYVAAPHCMFTAAGAAMARIEQHDAVGTNLMIMHMLSSRWVAQHTCGSSGASALRQLRL